LYRDTTALVALAIDKMGGVVGVRTMKEAISALKYFVGPIRGFKLKPQTYSERLARLIGHKGKLYD
jgi:hypothetical protein